MTEQELQLGLAKLLPKQLVTTDKQAFWVPSANPQLALDDELAIPVNDTEWLHICWLIETRDFVSIKQQDDYRDELCELFYKSNPKHTQICSASWQQRAEAILKVKGLK